MAVLLFLLLCFVGLRSTFDIIMRVVKHFGCIPPVRLLMSTLIMPNIKLLIIPLSKDFRPKEQHICAVVQVRHNFITGP